MDFILLKANPGVSGLTKLIADLINAFPSVAVGIIVFTLILKLATLVFDFYSRYSMRKSSLKMREMRPELERLQVQFKDNPQIYQQKVAALYKKEGYSMFGSCLPTIITLVIFIIVLNAFSGYSNIQNQKYLYNMAEAYNSVVLEGVGADGETLKVGKYVNAAGVEYSTVTVDADAIYGKTAGEEIALSDGSTLYIDETDANGNYKVHTSGGYVYVTFNVTEQDGVKTVLERKQFAVREEGLAGKTLDGKTYEEYKADALTQNPTATAEQIASNFIKAKQEQASADQYASEVQSFLWVKNIWKPDGVYALSGCTSAYYVNPLVDAKYAEGVLENKEDYAKLNAKLVDEGIAGQPNGYYILIALTILSTLLMQFISMRSQKDQMELGSVNGQGAQSQKIMMWMMPIMMAVFAFIYTAAFSLYIITSTLLSALTTVAVNKIVDYKFNKKKEAETQNIIRRG